MYCTDKDLAQRYGVTRKTIWVWAANGRIPKPVRISARYTRWIKDEIEQHDAKLRAERNSKRKAA